MLTIFQKPNFPRRKPRRGERGRITQKQRNLAIENFGDTCVICGQAPIELHHLVYKSQAGRGGWRNLIPLCNAHHKHVHRNNALASQLREERSERFGRHFSRDRYDLHEIFLINNPAEEEFEEFMLTEERYCSRRSWTKNEEENK